MKSPGPPSISYAHLRPSLLNRITVPAIVNAIFASFVDKGKTTAIVQKQHALSYALLKQQKPVKKMMRVMKSMVAYKQVPIKIQVLQISATSVSPYF